MANGFRVDLSALEQASTGVNGTLDQVDQLAVSAISHSPAAFGLPGLASTVVGFLDRWQRGVQNLAQDGHAIAARLTQNVAAYRAAEHSSAGDIGQINGELSGAGADPGIH
jgi:hypothetical protein